MAYDDTHCPCGGRKETETLLCSACVAHTEATPDMRVFRDEQETVYARRGAAIRLLAKARVRTRRLQPV